MCKCELVCSQIYVKNRILLFVLSLDFYVGVAAGVSVCRVQEQMVKKSKQPQRRQKWQ